MCVDAGEWVWTSVPMSNNLASKVLSPRQALQATNKEIHLSVAWRWLHFPVLIISLFINPYQDLPAAGLITRLACSTATQSAFLQPTARDIVALVVGNGRKSQPPHYNSTCNHYYNISLFGMNMGTTDFTSDNRPISDTSANTRNRIAKVAKVAMRTKEQR